MKKMAKRTLSLLLAALMVLSLIPAMPHAHAAGEEELTYGANWEYAETGIDPNTGLMNNYSWLNGVFKTADEDFIYGTSYDWSVTMSPTKAAASVTVEAIILQEDPAVEGGIEVARVTKDVDVSKAPSTTTLLSYADVAEQMAGKTGNFLLTLTTYWENPATGNTDAVAQLKTIFAYTGNASDDTVVEAPEVTLGAGIEFAASYKSWMTGEFKTAEEDFIYEQGKSYDWTFTIKQDRTTTAAGDLTVDATIKDAAGNVKASVANLPVIATKYQKSVMLSAADMNLDENLIGTFTLDCIVKYKGSAAASVTAVFSRTGAANYPGKTEWQYLVENENNYEWISGDFVSGDDDMVYKGSQAYDWYATISPTATAATVKVEATVVDASGNTVSTYNGTVEAGKAPAKTKVIASQAFPELTKDLFGTFTLTCKLMSEGGKQYAQLVAVFSREQSDGTDTNAQYDWIKVEYKSAEEDAIFEDEKPYDWSVTLQQQRVEAAVGIHATITDKLGNSVGEITKNVDIVKSEAGVPILEAAEFAELTTARGGEFTLVCEVTYNGDPVAKVTKLFSRPCKHTAEETILGKDAKCEDFGLTDGKKCLHCGEITVPQTEIPAPGHDIYDVEARVEPTCTTPGKSAHVKCRNCDYEKVGNELPVRTEHLPGAEATCLAPQTCVYCPEVIITPAKNHKYSVVDGKCMNGCGKTACENGEHTAGDAATCLAAQTCTKCGTELAKQKEHSFTGEGGKCVNGCGKTQQEICAHANLETIAGTPATCTATGLTDGKKCSDCGTVTVAQETIPALDHKMTETAAAVAATCDKAGKTAVLTCANGCGKTEGGAEIAALGHDWIAATETTPKTCKVCGKTEGGVATCKHEWTDATCTAPKTCKKCNETEGKPLAHDMKETAPAVAATCETEGKTAVLTCSYGCGKTEGGEKIAALGHKEETVAGKDATCTETGLTEGKKCATCGKVTVEQTTIPAKGHNFVDGVCSACGAKEEEKEPVVSGDADGNGKVNLRDAILVLKSINGGDALDPTIADVDGNGKVNLRDAILTLQLANGKEINK